MGKSLRREMQMVAIARALIGLARHRAVRRAKPGPRAEGGGRRARHHPSPQSEGVASLVVEQNAEIASSVADRAAILDRGRIAWSGRRRELREDKASRRKLLGA